MFPCYGEQDGTSIRAKGVNIICLRGTNITFLELFFKILNMYSLFNILKKFEVGGTTPLSLYMVPFLMVSLVGSLEIENRRNRR